MPETHELPTTVEECAREWGWKNPPGRSNRFALITPFGPVRLRRTLVSGGWAHWHIRGGKTNPASESHLLDNSRLRGPWKFVRTANGLVQFRADFPLDILADSGDFDFTGDRVPPAQTWVDDLSAYVMGDGRRHENRPLGPPRDLAGWLEARGWTAAAEGNSTRVTITLPRIFRQVRIEPMDAGTRLRAELVNLRGWPDECRGAALALAERANERLHLVRLALDESSEGEPLVAELHLGSLQVPGEWLTAALAGLRTAVALCARELPALRDPELAHLCLAAKSA